MTDKKIRIDYQNRLQKKIAIEPIYQKFETKKKSQSHLLYKDESEKITIASTLKIEEIKNRILVYFYNL